MKIVSRFALRALMGSTALIGASAALAQEPTDEIVVRAARIPDEKRATSEISSILDAASFQRTGDSDIGEALRRVTGISLSQGRFVIVRGLNERYSSVTLNGSPLPSPEPLRRVVPLDIIPTSALSGTLVQKTYSPQWSAEFGGGLVELRSKAIPSEPFFKIGLSVGADLVTTAQNGLVHDGGDLDWLGFDDGTRSLPGPLAAVFQSGAITPANQEAIDVSLENSRTSVISQNVIPPDYGVDLAFGASAEIGESLEIGGTVALSLDNGWETREGVRQQGYGSSLTPGAAPGLGLEGQDVNFRSTANTVDLNGIATFGAEFDNHKITSTSLIFRSSEKQSRISEGLDGTDPFGVVALKSNLRFFERQVWQTQLRGDHVFPSLGDLSVVWRGAYGEAYRDAPYQREYTYIRTQGTPIPELPFRDGSLMERGQFIAQSFSDAFPYQIDPGLVTGSTPNTLFFSRVDDQNIDAGIDFSLPLDLFEREIDVKFGYAYTDKSRDSLTRNFEYVSNLPVPPEIASSRIDQLLSPPVAGTPVFDLALLQATIDLDNSSSALAVHGAYVGLDAEINPYLRVAAGGRFETSDQSTTAFSTTAPASSLITTEIAEEYFLPAATITWIPLGDLQVRGGYSKTITRPQFRELTPAFFTDDDTDLLIRGNPFLENTRIDNYDLRAEYYFGRGQFVTLGGFYKNIDRPIEESFARDIGGLPVISFINAPSAELYGFEFEFEKNFAMADLVDWSGFESKDLIFKTNYTYSKSKVSADGDVVTPLVTALSTTRLVLPATSVFFDGRPLQGQSEHLFNLQLGWEDSVLDSRATFLVNWASSRIRNVEAIETGGLSPRVIERPPLTLDFVYSRGFEKFGNKWELGFKIQNLLGDDYEARQTFPDGTVLDFDTYKRGRELSASISTTF